MTQARELYAKITDELDRATLKRDDLRSRLDAVQSAARLHTDDLTALAGALLPDAAKVLPTRFSGYAEAARKSAAALDEAGIQLTSARETESLRQRDFALARHDFGESAETRRRIMIESADYREAVNGLAVGDRLLKANEPLLRSAEQKLARLTELARQNPVHALLMRSGNMAPKGHFILSLLNTVGERMRSTQWYRKADADRRDAEALVVERKRLKVEAEQAASRNQAAIDMMRSKLEESLRPEHAALASLKEAAEAARADREKAQQQMVRAERARRAVEDMTTPETKSALSGLVRLLSQTTSEDALDRDAIAALAEIPGAKPSLERAAKLASEISQAMFAAINLRESLETAQSAVDELDKMKRKMKRSGMSNSSRKVDDVEAFMSSGGTGGFDLETLLVLSAVSDAVSEASPSSSSDWTSSSSSSFD